MESEKGGPVNFFFLTLTGCCFQKGFFLSFIIIQFLLTHTCINYPNNLLPSYRFSGGYFIIRALGPTTVIVCPYSYSSRAPPPPKPAYAAGPEIEKPSL